MFPTTVYDLGQARLADLRRQARHQPHNQPWPDIQVAQHRKVTQMTTPVTRQPRHPLIRWATAPFRALRSLNQELLAAGEAIARSNRFPQPRPQASPAEATPAQPVPVSKVPTRA